MTILIIYLHRKCIKSFFLIEWSLKNWKLTYPLQSSIFLSHFFLNVPGITRMSLLLYNSVSGQPAQKKPSTQTIFVLLFVVFWFQVICRVHNLNSIQMAHYFSNWILTEMLYLIKVLKSKITCSDTGNGPKIGQTWSDASLWWSKICSVFGHIESAFFHFSKWFFGTRSAFFNDPITVLFLL